MFLDIICNYCLRSQVKLCHFFSTLRELRFHRVTRSWLCGWGVASAFLNFSPVNKRKILSSACPRISHLTARGFGCPWLCSPCWKVTQVVYPEKDMKYKPMAFQGPFQPQLFSGSVSYYHLLSAFTHCSQVVPSLFLDGEDTSLHIEMFSDLHLVLFALVFLFSNVILSSEFPLASIWLQT